MDKPLMEFDSHIAGKNARVRVFPDRIEWDKTGWMGTGSKLALGAMTVGVSLLATGVRGKGEDEMILIRSITSVATKKSGLTKTAVEVITSGNIIDFRCSPGEALRFKELVLRLVASGGAPATPQSSVVVQQPPQQAPEKGPDPMEQLHKLGELRDAGILSPEEFEAKKAEILARM